MGLALLQRQSDMPQPDHADHPPKPRKGRPYRRLTPQSSYTYAATDDLYRDLLQYAADRLRDNGEPYSFQAACASVYLNLDQGIEKTQTDYYRIWGWTRGQIREVWSEIFETVENWRTSFGRAKNYNQTTTRLQPRHNHENGDSAPESQPNNHATTTLQPDRNHHIITTPTTTLQEEDLLSTEDSDTEPITDPGAEPAPPPTEPPTPDPEPDPEPDEIGEMAERIWQAYPKKSGKQPVLKKIHTLLRKGLIPEHFPSLLAAVEEYARAREGQPRGFTLLPSTFFGPQCRYNDDPEDWWAGRDDRRRQIETIAHAEFLRLTESDRFGWNPCHDPGDRTVRHYRGGTVPPGYVAGYPGRDA